MSTDDSEESPRPQTRRGPRAALVATGIVLGSSVTGAAVTAVAGVQWALGRAWRVLGSGTRSLGRGLGPDAPGETPA